MDIIERAVIDADPDAVWEVGGDASNVADWIPALESSSLDGDLRRAVFAGGGGERGEGGLRLEARNAVAEDRHGVRQRGATAGGGGRHG